jgi:5-methylthioribose kinase
VPPLDVSTVGAYLFFCGLVADPGRLEVEPLSGGFINNVFRVTADGHEYVVKQALAESTRTVLRADIRRSEMEAAAMVEIRRFVGSDCPIPEVLVHDPDAHVTVMTAAPRTAVLYQDELIAGRCHPAAAHAVGAYAARLHETTGGDESLARRFATNPGFALRDQTIRSVGDTLPDLRDNLDTILDRDWAHASALVDYDITPKNILVHGDAVTKLDFECAKWGDPAFDVGLALAHFLLVAFSRPDLGAALVDEARAWYAGYTAHREAAPDPGFVVRAKDYLAAMMLARSNGDLIFDFLEPHRAVVAAVARTLLDEHHERMEQVLARAAGLIPAAAAVDQR